MSYEGSGIMDLIGRLDEASKRAGYRMVEHMQTVGEHNIRINTPVETFHLRNSYERSDVDYKAVPGLRSAMYAWEGTVFTQVEYAPYVEAGTGLWGPKRKKYKIMPKKPGGVLRFTPYSRMPNGGVILDVAGSPKKGGGPITVRFVMHPGSPGAHMFAIGVELTEAQYQEWSLEPLRLWKQEVEGNQPFLTRIRAESSFRVRA